MTNWADDTTGNRTLAGIEQAVRLNFGVTLAADRTAGNGSADDYAGLQAQITAAIAAGKRLVLQRDKTYLIGTGITIPGPLKIDGNGATIKKAPALASWGVTVTGANVEISDLNVDGNRSGGNSIGNGCVLWSTGATAAVARRVKATNTASRGLRVANGAVVDCYDCESSNHVVSLAGDGFYVDTGGVLRCWNCRADNNDRTGFYFAAGSAYGCHLDGTANNNTHSGTRIECSSGTIGRFYSRNNGGYGIYAASAVGTDTDDWTCNHIEATDSGLALNGEYTFNGAASGMQLLGCNNWHVASFTSRRNPGYGLTFCPGGDSGSSYNTVGKALVDGCSDPALFIGNEVASPYSCNYNTVSNLTVRRSTVAVQIGGSQDHHNHIGTLRAIECTFNVLTIAVCNNNTIGKVIATDCTVRAPYTQLFRIRGLTGTCNNNVVHYWQSDNPTAAPSGSAKPSYVMTTDANAGHNWIASGYASGYITAVMQDLGGTSRVDLATPP